MSNLNVNSEKCIACGKCYLNFPEVFDCHDDGIAFVLENATAEQLQAARPAIFECPTRAISQTDSVLKKPQKD